jgi:hypothetical protein
MEGVALAPLVAELPYGDRDCPKAKQAARVHSSMSFRVLTIGSPTL